MNLQMMPDRLGEEWQHATGILVRTQLPADHPEKPAGWVNADIAQLDPESLRFWLRSRGGDNEWAENTVAILLGHRS